LEICLAVTEGHEFVAVVDPGGLSFRFEVGYDIIDPQLCNRLEIDTL
jgi:hypothetical protein